MIEEAVARIVATGEVGALAVAYQSPLQDTRARDAASMAADYADRPRYAIAEIWGHYFSDSVPELDVRWVFDRHWWCVAVLHVKRRSNTLWSMGLPDEVADVEESLVDANVGALDLEMEDFGVCESDAMPEWASEASIVERCSFVQALP